MPKSKEDLKKNKHKFHNIYPKIISIFCGCLKIYILSSLYPSDHTKMVENGPVVLEKKMLTLVRQRTSAHINIIFRVEITFL